LRALIVGYGHMGREIEKALTARGHVVVGRIDPLDPGADARVIEPSLLSDCDVAIEFSLPAAVGENAATYADSGIPAVIGTTGWEAIRPDVLARAAANGNSLVWGNNFSIGANLFARIATVAAKYANSFDEYDAFLHEYHHRRKKDSPSGTALMVAQRVVAELDTKSSVVTERLDRPPAPEELHVSSTRGGSVPGTHTLTFDSDADTIEITHRARNRSGFASGAVRAAEWLLVNPGVHAADDVFDAILKERS